MNDIARPNDQSASVAREPMLMQPLDAAFDQAIRAIASTLPRSFVVSNLAPATFDELRATLDQGGAIEVWSGASDYTIYGAAAVNHAFRAWHDWCHYEGQQPFSLPGEAATALLQIEQIARYASTPVDLARWKAFILSEVVGQALFQLVQGSFPGNQRRFVKAFAALLHEPEAMLPEDVPTYER